MKKTKAKQEMNCGDVVYDNPSAVHESLKPYLGYLLHKTSLVFRFEGSKKLAPLGLQPYHFAALLIIESDSNTNQNQICTETGVDKATMVKTIDHLEDSGLVERVESKNDRRVKNLILTKKGKQTLEKAKLVRKQHEKDFMRGLGEAEIKNFKATLLKLIESRN